jgi:hypothetical protein
MNPYLCKEGKQIETYNIIDAIKVNSFLEIKASEKEIDSVLKKNKTA